MAYTTDELYDMTTEQLNEAVKAAKAEMNSPETAIEEEAADLDTVDVDSSDELDELEDAEEESSDTEEGDSLPEDDASEQDADKDQAGPEAGSEASPAAAAPAKMSFTAVGKKYEFTEEEVKAAFPRVFGQAVDYTQKMQAIAPWRKTIDAITQAKLDHKDISLMIDVLKGDKEAIAAVLKRTGVDTLDINTDEVTYVQKDYGRTNTELEIVDVLDRIKHDPEYTTTHRVLASEWDAASWSALSSNPVRIQQLHNDVKDGTFAMLQPEANKLKVFDGGRRSDLEYYIEAARNHHQAVQTQTQAALLSQQQERQRQAAAQSRVEQAKQQQQQREAAQQDASKRRAAAPTGRSAPKPTVTDYLNASDVDYKEWYDKLQRSL